MTSKDAFMFPLIASCFLFGLYLLFKLFKKDLINFLLISYFMFFGVYALIATFKPLSYKILPNNFLSNQWRKTFIIPQFWLKEKKEPFKLRLNTIDILSVGFAIGIGFWYLWSRHWIANNVIGLAFCIQGIAFLSLGAYKAGCILLSGLFFYDIFWVFGTDVMVTVAKSFDAPVKLLFPRNLFDPMRKSGEGLSMLGLGDIVLPGVFIAFLLRYDAYRYNKRTNFPTTYFQVTFISYLIGLFTTMFVMHTFQAAQPALLYLVPAVIGSSFITAILQNDVDSLFQFDEGKEDKQEKKNEIQNDEISGEKQSNKKM